MGDTTHEASNDLSAPERAAEFTALYNELEAFLRREMRIDRRYDFMDLVNEGVRRRLVPAARVNELRDCKALRNLLVHTTRDAHNGLAQPTPWGLRRFRAVVEEVVRPPLVFPTFRRRVQLFTPAEHLSTALRHMAEKDYSQIVVRFAGRLTVLSSLGITRWLSTRARDDTLAVADCTVGDVLEHEPQGSFGLLSRTATVDEARDLFERAPGLPQPRVQAVIITENGKETEEPLGFATPWDLMTDED